MSRIVPLRDVNRAVRGGVVSIGNFDGVHRGHAALIDRARELATTMSSQRPTSAKQDVNQAKCPVVAVVLDPHPAAILRPDSVPAKLTTIEYRAELLTGLGADFVVIVPTSEQFLTLTAAEFFDSLIHRQLSARGIVEGPNFFFGRGRQGSIETLKKLCQNHAIELSVAGAATQSDGMISSTRIRQLLTAGDIEGANRMLGRTYRVTGKVTRGAGRGRGIGFPTANLSEIPSLVPAQGVYAGFATVGSGRLPAAIHIGPNPTFDDSQERKVEVHVLHFSGDLYNDSLSVDFSSRVRDIARFESAEQLIDQLHRDMESVRASLAVHHSSTDLKSSFQQSKEKS